MKRVITLSIGIFILTSCGFSDLEFDKVQNPTINSNLAFPLGSISYRVSDLIDDISDESLEVNEGEDFFLSFLYRDTTIYNSVEEFVSFTDVSNTEDYYPIPSDIPSSGSSQTVMFEKDFDFTFGAENGEIIDSVYFKGGTLEYTIQSDFDFQVDYTFTLTDIKTMDNMPLVFDRAINGATIDSQSRSMFDTKLISTPTAGENVFTVHLSVTLNIPANTSVSSASGFNITVELKNPELRAAFGDFGQEPISVLGNDIEIGAFKDFGDGNIDFLNPSLTLEIDNSFGLEIGLSLDGIKATTDENEVLLSGDVVDNLQYIGAPDVDQIGEVVTTQVVINSTNSNLPELVNLLPENLSFDLSAIPNPIGSSNLEDFFFDDQQMEIRSIFEIPLELNMDGFTKEFDFSLSSDALKDAESLSLVVKALNEIPFSGVIDITFLDEDEVELYKLAEVAIIDSPELDGEGRTLEAQLREETIDLDQEGINAFLNADKVVVTFRVYTFESGLGNHVKIFSDYELTIDLAVIGQISVDL